MTREASNTGPTRQHGLAQGMLALWDISKQPLTNDREAKLGFGNGAIATTIVGFNEATLADTIADGIANPLSGLHVSRLFEPDNWTPRIHVEGGRGRDVVQALRLIADSTNPHDVRTHRSTQIVDQ